MDSIKKKCPPEWTLQETQCSKKPISVYSEEEPMSSTKNNSHVNERMQDIFAMFFGAPSGRR